MSREDDWKQQAIQHDLAVLGARARRAGAQERSYVDDKGRVRMIEQIGKRKIVRTYLSEDGLISRVSISSVSEELREINRQWDEMAPLITPEMLAKYISLLRSADDPKRQHAVEIALGHIWRRRKDLRTELARLIPDIKSRLKAGRK